MYNFFSVIFIFFYLQGRATERHKKKKKKEGEILHLLVNNCQDLMKLKEPGTPLASPKWMTGVQELGPYSVAVPSILAGNWIGSRTSGTQW